MHNVRRKGNVAHRSAVSDRVAKSEVYWAVPNIEPAKDSPVALVYLMETTSHATLRLHSIQSTLVKLIMCLYVALSSSAQVPR